MSKSKHITEKLVISKQKEKNTQQLDIILA